jgi:hypothetical protein
MDKIIIWLNGFYMDVEDREDYEKVKAKVKVRIAEMVATGEFDFETEDDNE